MKLNSLYDVYVAQLKDMYSAEKQLVEALPKMATAASAPELRSAFEKHLGETRGHMQSVRQILDELDENPTSTKCAAMEGLIEEGKEITQTAGKNDALDVALILAAQKVEHYEIATYGGLRTFAKTLGYNDAAQSLQQLLDEEYEADQALDDLAEGLHSRSSLNVAALK